MLFRGDAACEERFATRGAPCRCVRLEEGCSGVRAESFTRAECQGQRKPGAIGPPEGSLEPKAVFNINTNSKEFSQGGETLLSS